MLSEKLTHEGVGFFSVIAKLSRGGEAVLSASGWAWGTLSARYKKRGVGVERESTVRLVSYPDPYFHSCGWITSPLRSGDVIHPQLS